MEENFVQIQEKLKLNKVIGNVGIKDVTYTEVQSWRKLLENESSFNKFVKDNYKRFRFDTYNISEDIKKAIFARFVYNCINVFVITNKGNFFNGKIYIPRRIVGNKIDVLESNYFSRMGFIACNNNELLNIYNEHLQAFDKTYYSLLDIRDNEILTINEINHILKYPAITSHTISFIVKTIDGYIYPIRGKGLLGAGKETTFTGIVDKLDLEKLIIEEVFEELGFNGKLTINFIGNSIINQKALKGLYSVICFNFIIDLDITSEFIMKKSENAIDNYENERINKNNNFESFYDNYSENYSIALKAFIDLMEKQL